MSLKFSELKKIKRGEAVSSDANKIALEAVIKLGKSELIELFKKAESLRWHGELLYPKDADIPVFECKFRHGIFQYFKLNITEGKALFRLNVINENVDFREDKSK